LSGGAGKPTAVYATAEQGRFVAPPKIDAGAPAAHDPDASF
jgi:hypothetical protein